MNGTMMSVPLTLTPLFTRAISLFAEREIISRRSDRSIHRYRYADFGRRSLQLAEALTRAGLQPGDRVATLMWTDSSHLEAYFGIPLAGGVLHTINLRLPPAQLAFIIKDAGDRFLIVDETLLPLVASWWKGSGLERVFVVRDERAGAAALPDGLESYESFLRDTQGKHEPPEIQESDACGMCYTSGTTGNPKGVVYTHRSTVLHSLVISLPDCLGISQDDAVLPVVPMFHVNAWGIPYASVMVGAKLVLPGRHLDPVSLLELYESEQVSMTAGVPSIWLGVLQALEREPQRWKLPRMRMVVGGSASPESLLRGFDRHGQTVIHAWGMTETSPAGLVSRIKPTLAHGSEAEKYRLRAKQGVPVPLVEARIVGQNGPAAHDGKAVGELEVRGPCVTASYFGSANDPEKFTADGWLRTGDIATIDAEGYVHIVDRLKDLVKSGGEWICSVELENAIMAHPAVLEACVVAVPHQQWGERPLALVAFRQEQQASTEELRQHLTTLVPKWWLPDGFVTVPEVQKTTTGKFDKMALRDRYATWRA
jgi:fatty-acyl-CoA synthase